MKPARLIILSVAAVAAGLAGYLALHLSGGRNVSVTEVTEARTIQENKVEVLVAKKNLAMGSRLDPESIGWLPWPESAVVDGFITKQNRPSAVDDLQGSIVRLPIFVNEPVRLEKVVDKDSRTLSSILPAGKRAMATEISVATGAGGFILPNDRVDVIMVRKGEGNVYQTETILKNIRVLAIDQQIQQGEDGRTTAVGSTATLEVTPEQAKVIAVSQQVADRLTLSLRSVADAQDPDTGAATHLLSGGEGTPVIQVIKSGSISTAQ